MPDQFNLPDDAQASTTPQHAFKNHANPTHLSTTSKVGDISLGEPSFVDTEKEKKAKKVQEEKDRVEKASQAAPSSTSSNPAPPASSSSNTGHLSTTSKVGDISLGNPSFVDTEKAKKEEQKENNVNTTTSSTSPPITPSILDCNKARIENEAITRHSPTAPAPNLAIVHEDTALISRQLHEDTPNNASQPTNPAPIAQTTEDKIALPESSSPNTILLRSPRKFNLPQPPNWKVPPLEWLETTWSVTHSTLPMWRKAKNVQITYKLLPNGTLDDTVSSIPTQKTWMPQPKTISGIDTPDGDGAWAWRGKGLLKVASSKWEVLGWGEKEEERWVVTYFAASMFTPMGLDLYSSQKEGMSEGLFGEIMKALENLEARECVELVKADMREVKIEY